MWWPESSWKDIKIESDKIFCNVEWVLTEADQIPGIHDAFWKILKVGLSTLEGRRSCPTHRDG